MSWFSSDSLELALLSSEAGAHAVEQRAIWARIMPDQLPELTLAILDPLALIAYLATGAVAGLLAGLLGIGGGALIVPALIAVFSDLHLDGLWVPHQAVATSLATIIATGSASAYSHHRRGGVDWSVFGVLGPALLIGAGVGALFGGAIAPLWLQRLFALFLFYTGARMLLRKPQRSSTPFPARPRLLGTGIGFGALAALLGVGGGILVVPFLARHGIALRRAVGTASACGVPIAAAGSLGFVLSGWDRAGLLPQSLGFVYWPAALAIVATSMPFANLGARLAHRLPTLTLKRVFAVLLLLVGIGLLRG
ncbi:MAG: sulfite exporter TauE/SafE family protein [Lamprobacter sp.]|uniref:sulfite exporter TauE/SafE family protein n=1 Tax=Lamprobacter sp. TaxID=3100796 RepID=UPI002B25C76F|nr:sulfite exporter TauE/SafE family protein [Lamprobacter sp.]MEA3640821.1 sulfite exporter TauE/SafE family protein [Lamprobacter sp.]